jgi:hypothetical protein
MMMNWKLIYFLARCLLLGLSVIAPASAAELVRAQFLLAAPEAIAPTVQYLAAKTQVDILERRGGWNRVRAQGREGWLRLLALRETRQNGAIGQNLLALVKSGRSDPGRVTGVAGIRSLQPPRASAHALILTIGEYRSGTPRLQGVTHDADSAVLMARALGISEANTTVLNNTELTLTGLRKAIDELESRVLPNDEVFLYYSGHGARELVTEGSVNRCAEALLSVDGEVLLDSELEQRLQRLTAKARRVVMFIDASHAGGIKLRTAGQFSAKVANMASAKSCDNPVNALTRGLISTDPGRTKANFVLIAAAQEGETALDDAQRGGLASRAWLDCLAGEANDADASGGLSAREIQACAQPRIEQLMRGNTAFSPQHLALIGNTSMVLATPDTLPKTVDAAAVLKDIHANRDVRRQVRLIADKPEYKVGKDRIRFNLESSHAGYVYLLMAGSDGKQFDMLFPNKKDDRNLMQANETWNLPRPGWAFRAGGPAGRDQLLVLVSDKPRDFSALGMVAAGPFSSLAASPVAARNIQIVSDGDEETAPPECTQTGAERTANVAAACSNAYGADLIELVEFN